MTLIKGFGLAGYRSFPSSRMSYFANLSNVNLIVGQNNAGKSNVLRVVQSIDQAAIGRSGHDVLDRSSHDPESSVATGATFAIAYSVEDARARIKSILQIDDLKNHQEVWVAALSSALQVDSSHKLMWVHYRVVRGQSVLEVDSDWAYGIAASVAHEDNEVFRYASRDLTSTSGGGAGGDFVRVVSRIFDGQNRPRVETINAFRQIRPGADELGGNSNDGVGLIERLDALRGPDAAHYADREKFDSIQNFVRAVLDDPHLQIDIPSSRNTINVIQRGSGRPLPLENMGTGIHQVVILAVAATLLTETLICMEEPEIHLHPILQRKLLRYLAEKTTNQYLIATHSAHMLDSSIASIFHVAMTDRGSVVRPALLPQDRADICADLGYRASDLVQANAVVWVEGPSDRIYLQNWLSARAPDLVEGIHFSIMFYGGRLLNHLSANDPDVDDFISLKRLNRHVAILIDSDKRAPRGSINKTKRRVRDEIQTGAGYAWITSGYTIENYVPVQLLKEAVIAAHPSAAMEDYGRYDNPLGGGVVKNPAHLDKVAVARQVGLRSDSTTAWHFDLEIRIRGLIDFIHDANGSTVLPAK